DENHPDADDQKRDRDKAGEGQAAAVADDRLLFGCRSRFGFHRDGFGFERVAVVATVAAIAAGAGITAVFAADALAALGVFALDAMFVRMAFVMGGDVLAGGGAATAGAAGDGQRGAGGAEHESGHQEEGERESRFHESSLLTCDEARSRALGLTDHLKLDPVELQRGGFVPVGAERLLDVMKLGRNAVAVRVAVHLLPYTKHNGISQLKLSKG